MPTMEQKAELRLPTIAVPVKLVVVGHAAVTAELFVGDVPRSSRTQLLDDIGILLDQDTSFLPIRGEGGVRLLAKHWIAWIAITRSEETEQDDFDDSPSEVITLYDRRHPVVVQLVTGEALAGTLFDSSPADRPRVIDHLNRAGRFVRLWTPEDHYLIAKQHILEVKEQE
jgi:hypothetical protein